jgi:hypothetical protein
MFDVSGRSSFALLPSTLKLLRDKPATGGGESSLMGNSQGRDNVRKRKARRKKTERLALAKKNKKAPAK